MAEHGTRIFIADPDLEMVNRLRPALAASSMNLVATSPSADAAVPDIVAQRPDVLLLDDAATTGTPADLIRRLAAAAPDLCIIVTAASGTSPSLMGRAVAAGARGFLLKPYGSDELITMIREATSAPRQQHAASPKGRGRIVSVYAPKGGAGATTVAVNTAVAIAGAGVSRVGLVDLDLQFGDVGVALNLSGANSIAELLGQPTISDELVKETFLTHPSGVRVLLAPEDLSVVESIEPGDVTHALDQLRGHFDILVCDLWSMFEHLTRSVLRMSDQVVLVTTPDLPALNDLRRVLLAGRDELRSDERTIVVVNRAAGKAGFSIADVEKVLDRPVSFTIPSDGGPIAEAVNRGLSILDTRVRTKAAKPFRDIAARLVTPPARTPSMGQVATGRVHA